MIPLLTYILDFIPEVYVRRNVFTFVEFNLKITEITKLTVMKSTDMQFNKKNNT